MKQTLFLMVLIALVATGGSLVAQEVNDIQAEQLGQDTAQQALQEVSISRFEDPGFWRTYVPHDAGVITHRRLEGGPMDKEPIEAEVAAGIDIPDDYVLGIKTEFFRRGITNIYVEAIRPLPVPGIAKTLSVWVVGRNFNHELYAIIRDQFGNQGQLYMGRMNFSGWRRMTTAIPPNIMQRNVHYPHLAGIEILGFLIRPAMLETYGSYYVYFDDLRVMTDLFTEESRDPDDMVDGW
ncbi:MAG: flagellar filament protein FlaA [Spirochaetaceae bacterium]|nr:MAG: flagellar filament protein FlaA [Spirochaetaceae bacterium]